MSLQPVGQVELALVSEGALEHLVERILTAGISLERGITDEAFGLNSDARPGWPADQINEHDTELYT